MIDVASVLTRIPRFTSFCSVAELGQLAEALRDDARFRVTVAGTSVGGRPIHHVRFGTGTVKALFVGFPHCDEPIGGLTVFSLLTLLKQGHPALVNAGVEWHVIPCIDPDGAVLNEGWTQQPFTLGSYMRHFHKQELADQVDASFPIEYKRLSFDEPTREAGILKRLLDQIRPDFYCSLHNAIVGGAFFCLTRNIDTRFHRQLYELLEQQGLPLQARPPDAAWCPQFAAGIEEAFTTRRFYDFLEQTTPSPESLLRIGACSWEYLAQIRSAALGFVAELPYLKHPLDESQRDTGESLRRLKLRIDADNKYLVTVILEEWARVAGELDTASPFYRKVLRGTIEAREKLHEGLPSWPYKTRDILFNPAYDGTMTESQRLNVYLMDRFWLLCHSHEFVRLLQASTQSGAVRSATSRLARVFDEALLEVEDRIDARRLEVIDHDTLARAQLGSGLIALNAVLEGQPGRFEI
jgi:hypothetical protein